MELNRNPENFFAEVEQSAFNPANVVPGIGFSPDRMLQGGSSLSNGKQADAAYGKGVAAALGIAMTEVVTKSGALAEAA